MRLRYGDEYKTKPLSVVNREPNLGDLIENFAAASVRVRDRATRFGLRSVLVNKEAFDLRLATCRRCPLHHWDEDARLGLGKCKHEKCGCTKLKLWLASERCPAGFWE